MKLIGTLTSPYVRKTRVTLLEKKINYEFILTELNSPSNAVLKFNPLAKVPCIVTENGKAIFDSSVIVDYADTLSPVSPLLPADSAARADIKCLEALADGIMDAAILVRMESKRPEDKQSAEWVAIQQEKVDAGLKALSEKLKDRLYLAGDTFSLADIAAGCALGWLANRFPENPWPQNYPNLKAFFERLSERESFKRTRPELTESDV